MAVELADQAPRVLVDNVQLVPLRLQLGDTVLGSRACWRRRRRRPIEAVGEEGGLEQFPRLWIDRTRGAGRKHELDEAVSNRVGDDIRRRRNGDNVGAARRDGHLKDGEALIRRGDRELDELVHSFGGRHGAGGGSARCG
jgi:hypothetical protein